MIFLIVVALAINQPICCLINLNDPIFQDTIVYKCPIVPNSMYPDRLDQSIIVLNNETIQNLIQSAAIVLRTASMIMHELIFYENIDGYSFYHASLADLNDVIEHTKITGRINAPGKVNDDINLYTEDVLTDFEYNQLKNISSFDNGIHEIIDDDSINHEIYKCIGNPIDTTKYFSVFIVLKKNFKTSQFKVGDIIFGLSSYGYLENITNIDTIETLYGDKMILETKLTQCGNYPNSIFNNIIRKQELNTSLSDLDCSGDSISKLYVVDSYSSSVSVGNLIPGRESSSFGIQVLAKYIIGEYVVFEGISVQHLTKKLVTKFYLHKKYSYPFSKTYKYAVSVPGSKIKLD
jgi:hypothetical protein